MKNVVLFLFVFSCFFAFSQQPCTFTNSSGCSCEDPTLNDCDLLPDLTISWEAGLNGHTEYSQTGNGSNDGRLRVDGNTPNIGWGPLTMRGIDEYGYKWYICYDAVTGVGDTFSIYDPNFNDETYCADGSTPDHIAWQRIYHKNSDGTMTSSYVMSGTMTYHPTHGHMHFNDWTVLTLRVEDPNEPNPLNWPIVGDGAKLGFCIMDLSDCDASFGDCKDDNTVYGQGNVLGSSYWGNNYNLDGGYGCSPIEQGISVGHTDIYGQHLDGMWVNIPPGTCNGDYWVVLEVDPNEVIIESNEVNNYTLFPITLTEQVDPVNFTASFDVNGGTSLCSGDSSVLTASWGSSYLWSTGETTQSVSVTNPGDYWVTVQNNICLDPNGNPAAATSDTISFSVNSSSLPTSVLGDTVCVNGTGVLNAYGSGDINWYLLPNGGAPISTGSSLTVPGVSSSTTYYVSNTESGNSASYSVGPNHTGSSLYSGSQYNAGVIFDVSSDIVINSVNVYTDTPGDRRIMLEDANGNVLQDLTVFIDSSSFSQTINLSFSVPAGNDYYLTTDGAMNYTNFGDNSPVLQRSNSGVSYPYEVAGVVSIKDSPYGGDYYYYFYEWEIEAPEYVCESNRVPVELVVISCSSLEDPNVISNLNVFPNPTKNILNFEVDLKHNSDVFVSLKNSLGSVVLKDSFLGENKINGSFSTKGLSYGVYYLNVEIDGNVSVFKVVKH